jgi:aminoglycoside phosphotransferase
MPSRPMTAVPNLTEAQIATMLSAPDVQGRLGGKIGAVMHVTPLDEGVFQISGEQGELILRFARDEAQLALLKKEESVQRGFREQVSLRIPDTRVIDDLDDRPAFAVHNMVPGEPLTSEMYAGLSSKARRRLVVDLAEFFHQSHAIPVAAACAWLGLRFEGTETVERFAMAQGKPLWFNPHAVADMRPWLGLILDGAQNALFEDTVRRFAALGCDTRYMVFGHGDLHGYNMAMGCDDLGPKLTGVFDLGCAGILDVHEDFFRLSLVSEDLLESVLERYQRSSEPTHALRRDRIAIYYRAFLFYLMAEQSGEGLEHLKRLLQKHLAHYG